MKQGERKEVWISKELHKRIKIKAVTEDVRMEDLVAKILTEKLDEEEKKND
jgi:predicted HicB family RNase H-like nuclease